VQSLRFPASTLRWSRVLFLSSALVLCLLVSSSSREAFAAVAPGGTEPVTPSGSFAVLQAECSDAACGQVSALQVCDSCGVEWTYWLIRSDVDPRTRCTAEGNLCRMAPAAYPDEVVGAVSPVRANNGTSVTYPQHPSGPGQFLYATSGSQTVRYVTSLWNLGPDLPDPTTPPTTTAPTTTTPPPGGGGTDPTTTSPGTTSPAPGGTSSTGCGATEAEPCFVHQVNPVPVDVGSITVSALTDDQWAEILLALGALTFFSAASFVSGWRRGRRG
jgi:hypothetical protein